MFFSIFRSRVVGIGIPIFWVVTVISFATFYPPHLVRSFSIYKFTDPALYGAIASVLILFLSMARLRGLKYLLCLWIMFFLAFLFMLLCLHFDWVAWKSEVRDRQNWQSHFSWLLQYITFLFYGYGYAFSGLLTSIMLFLLNVRDVARVPPSIFKVNSDNRPNISYFWR